MKAFLWIEDIWVPQLQREGDEALMQRFLRCPQISRAMLRQANAVRLYLRVVTIADLADAGGTFIPAGMLTGKWQAGSDLKWPYQPLPPAKFWSAFQRCLRLTFSTRTPPYHHPTHSLELDRTLGKWFDVPRNTWYTVYRSDSGVLWRDEKDGVLYQMKPSPVRGFYHIDHRVQTLPVNSHPICFRQMGNTIWTHGKYAPHLRIETVPPPGVVIEDTTVDEAAELVTLASDGSVFLHEGKASCAWILHQSDQHQLKACYLLEQTPSLTSYRSELEGIYRGLHQLLDSGIQLERVHQWCDNKAAVDRSNSGLTYPGAMLNADADIILAIGHVRQQLSGRANIICRHVYGHQDSRQTRATETIGQEEWESDTSETEDDDDEHQPTRSPDTGTPTKLPISVQLNIECDRIATETVKAAISNTDPVSPLVLNLPYPGS
jgi:ribonuclease HI